MMRIAGVFQVKGPVGRSRLEPQQVGDFGFAQSWAASPRLGHVLPSEELSGIHPDIAAPMPDSTLEFMTLT